MRCTTPTAKGEPCVIGAGSNGLCHLHDPNGVYARQHPKYRAKLLEQARKMRLHEEQAAMQITLVIDGFC